jgi:hypothetical protein
MAAKDTPPLLARVLAAVRAQLRRFDEGPPPSTWRTPITLANWVSFQVALARALAHLEVGATVVINDGDRIYVQFAQDANGLHVEAVSNRFLREEQWLSAEQEEHMAAAGWQRPDRRCPNWWLDCPQPLSAADFRRIAELAVLALRDELQVTALSFLEYSAWNAGTRAVVDLPELHPAAE